MVRKRNKVYPRKHPVKSIHSVLAKDINQFRREIKERTGKKLTFRKASELWFKVNVKKFR